MSTIESNETTWTSGRPDVEALIEENRSLRSYLSKVLHVLETKVDDAPTGSNGQIADIDIRLRQAEATIADLTATTPPSSGHGARSDG